MFRGGGFVKDLSPINTRNDWLKTLATRMDWAPAPKVLIPTCSRWLFPDSATSTLNLPKLGDSVELAKDGGSAQ